jgi:LPXTG-motif cell wall-anchored protein
VNVLFFDINSETKSYYLIGIILISIAVFLGLLKKKENKKVETTVNFILALVSVLITVFLFYASF